MNESYPQISSYRLTRWLFLRLEGFIYLIAFASLGIQILGLVGEKGILPVAEYLNAVQRQLGWDRYLLVPTLCWLNSEDWFLLFLCWGGAVGALFLILGFAPTVVSFVLWVFYLSLTVAGQEFLSFQWDILLLEVGFLSIFLAERHILAKILSLSYPSEIIVWLLRWVLFRLLFESGMVKILSQDPNWRQLTALDYHYWTQCLPHILSWYVHQLPAWFDKVSVLIMFFIELVAPFFFFLGRRSRIIAFGVIVFLQLSIIFTGNYGFFNLLTLVLGVVLLDDGHLKRFFPHSLRNQDEGLPVLPAERLRSQQVRFGILAVGVVFLTTLPLVNLISGLGMRSYPAWIGKTVEYIRPLRSFNSYGLFAVMTTQRKEIIIEGSNDQQTWKEYEFRWKPGNIYRAPAWVLPHQPRLDWQMWFAAFGNYQQNPWTILLLKEILEGSPPVLKLIEYNPFPERPPQYIRSLIYDYHFTDYNTHQKTGAWWERKLIGFYTPVLSLK